MGVQAVLCPVLVGREAEVAFTAEAAAAVARTGNGVALAISGEAGIGKTRLAGEVQAVAQRLHFVRLVGGCALDATIPYQPFVAAIRRHTRRRSEAELAALFDGSALLAAALLPEAARVVQLPEGTVAADDLFAAVWQLLHRICGDGGLLMLEDVHWADQDSLRLLTYLIRELDELPLLLVMTYRPDELHRRHPLQDVLTTLTRERRLQEIRLQPLDREQTRALLSATFDGTEIGDEFLDAIQSRASGNPFFLEELAKALVDRGDVYRDSGDWARRALDEIELPDTVRDTLLDRCRDLNPDAVRVLQLAAVAGDALHPRVLARAANLDDGALDAILREALRLQLVVESVDGGHVRYQFRHALTREAFIDDIVGPDRRRAHELLADALLATHPDDVDEVAAEIADHLAEAGDAERALPYAITAARAAARARALDEAVRRYEQALSLMRRHHGDRLELLLEAAERTFDPLDRRAALAFATEARSLAQQQGDVVAEARALHTFERDLWHRGETHSQLQLVRQTLSLVEGRDEWQEAWTLRMLSRLLALDDRREEAKPFIERGLAVAARAGHDKALSGLYGTRALLAPVDTDEWRAAVDAGIRHARASGDGDTLGNILTNAGYMQLWSGHLAEARSMLDEAVEIYGRIKPTDRYTAAGLAWLLSLLGDYDRARQVAEPIAAADDAPPRLVALTALAEVAQRTGDDSADVVGQLVSLAQAVGTAQRVVPALAAAARQAVADNDMTAASRLFEEAIAATTAEDGRGSHWLFSPDYAAALASTRDTDRLRDWCARVDRLTAADPHRFNHAAARLCAAHLAAASENFAVARELFERSAGEFASLPCPARCADALLALADLEWSAGDRAASEAAAIRARDVAGPVNAQAIVAQADAAIHRAAAATVLATVLFTDIVGSTQLAAELGDTAWRAMLERHHAVVRRELTRHGGREIDTAGDGFLATFDSPAQAIRCAADISAALAQLGLTVRAGIHTGECQRAGDKLTGLAVHIAARVSATASPGEVWVSGTVRDLVVGSGLTFADRGAFALKGVPGEWQLYAVVAQPPARAAALL